MFQFEDGIKNFIENEIDKRVKEQVEQQLSTQNEEIQNTLIRIQQTQSTHNDEIQSLNNYVQAQPVACNTSPFDASLQQNMDFAANTQLYVNHENQHYGMNDVVVIAGQSHQEKSETHDAVLESNWLNIRTLFNRICKLQRTNPQSHGRRQKLLDEMAKEMTAFESKQFNNTLFTDADNYQTYTDINETVQNMTSEQLSETLNEVMM